MQENFGVEENITSFSKGANDLLSPFQMLRLLRNLRGRSQAQKEKILKDGLLVAINNIEQITNNLLDENLSLPKLEAHVTIKL